MIKKDVPNSGYPKWAVKTLKIEEKKKLKIVFSFIK